MQKIIEIINGIPRHPQKRMSSAVNLQILAGEQIAITGNNAAGKSRLVDIIIGRYPLLMNEVHYDFTPSPLKLVSENLKYITFRDSYGDSDTTYYYQQRWNLHDIDEKTPTAGDLLDQAYHAADKNVGFGLDEDAKAQAKAQREQLRDTLYKMFHLETLLDKYIISLSSGELRKFQLTRTLLSAPRMLIMDNPFIGLDAQTRQQLSDLLHKLIEETGLQIILVLSKTDYIPPYITHIIHVDNLEVCPKVTRDEFLAQQVATSGEVLPAHLKQWITDLPLKEFDTKNLFQYNAQQDILRFKDVGIKYGNRIILEGLNWTVKQGEKWALSGENGAGKSTLLSLVCADNPQSYACHIELFGKRRGTGESIWEIKRHIGYVSPEMHRAYLKDLPAIDIVASGLNDSVGLYTRPRPEQEHICKAWMEVMGIAHLDQRTFLQLSSGEQRLCLLARAFVKDPELLILDEPLHGLDNHNRKRVQEIITAFCQRQDKTMIMVTHYEEELPPVITNRIHLKKNV